MDAADWVASGIAALAVVVAAVAAVFAKRSADHAGDAVEEARQLREIEADRRADEKQRRHEELGPDLPGEIEAAFGGGGISGRVLYGAIEVDRVYRVRAYGRAEGTVSQLSFPTLTVANQRMQFVIESFAPGQTEPRFKEIVFKFWPPVPGVDEGSGWSCGCGGPGGEVMDGAGHWDAVVKVSWYDVEDSLG